MREKRKRSSNQNLGVKLCKARFLCIAERVAMNQVNSKQETSKNNFCSHKVLTNTFFPLQSGKRLLKG